MTTSEISAAPLLVQALARRFGRRWVLRGVDLSVARGEIVALTGRNGSGKTTLLRICATALAPSRGSAAVFGHDVVDAGGSVREHVGVLGHAAGLYDDLTAAENLVFAQRMSGGSHDPATIEPALAGVGLAEVSRERVRGFSAGMRRRLALARLILRPPRLLLLDEPYAAFDTDGIARVNAFARDVANAGGAVVIATHDLGRGRDVFTRRIHIHDGRAGDDELAGDPESRAMEDA